MKHHVLLLAFVLVCGCRTWDRPAKSGPAEPTFVPPPPPTQVPANESSPQPGLPPGALVQPAPPGPTFSGSDAPAGPSKNFYPPPQVHPPLVHQQVEYRWQPADGQVQLGNPQPETNKPGAQLKLYPPVVTEKPATPEPPLATPFPVGIAQFARAGEGVAVGLRPALEDGLDWLQRNGYKTVVHIHLPGEQDGADRKQVEKRGMTYVPLVVSPHTLAKTTVEEFRLLVTAKNKQPLFIYDRDGSLTGGLWYLYCRTHEQLDDEQARIRASGLGLREDRDGAHRVMWLAIQKMLSEKGR